jgi:hypothetical protein
MEQGLRGGVVVIFEVAELPLILEVTMNLPAASCGVSI